jgi:hypothetical protein
MTDASPDNHQAPTTNTEVPDANHQSSTNNDSPVEEHLSNGQSPSIPSSLSSDNPFKDAESQAEAPNVAEPFVAPVTPDHQRAIRKATRLVHEARELLYPRTATVQIIVSPDSPDTARSLLLEAIQLLESQSGLSAGQLYEQNREEAQETAETAETEEHEEAEDKEMQEVQATAGSAKSDVDSEAEEREVAGLRAKVEKLEDQIREMRKNLPDESSGSEKESEISG